MRFFDVPPAAGVVAHDVVETAGFAVGAFEFGDRAVADDTLELEGPCARVVLVRLNRDVGLELETDPIVGRDELELATGLGGVDVECLAVIPKETGTT